MTRSSLMRLNKPVSSRSYLVFPYPILTSNSPQRFSKSRESSSWSTIHGIVKTDDNARVKRASADIDTLLVVVSILNSSVLVSH